MTTRFLASFICLHISLDDAFGVITEGDLVYQMMTSYFKGTADAVAEYCSAVNGVKATNSAVNAARYRRRVVTTAYCPLPAVQGYTTIEV